MIDDQTRNLIDQLSPLAPLHNPAHLKGIDVARQMLPDVPHVAVFDTAFFQSLPEASATYALDKETADRYSIRRYGAHGTSHQYVSNRVHDLLGRKRIRQAAAGLLPLSAALAGPICTAVTHRRTSPLLP